MKAGIRRLAGRVKRWRGGSMIQRWMGAALHELQRGFHRIKGRRRLDRRAVLRSSRPDLVESTERGRPAVS
ncbi:hypothetical protein [Nannocystis exedens]|uniref:hypothetical protein n=1 Tax=Nannocystis exedens TaxID=54 RepID=UPI0011601BEC|nr:hypothetical protein [Nannocystis exedens]